MDVILQPGQHMAVQVLTDKGRKSWAPKCRIASGCISYSFFFLLKHLEPLSVKIKLQKIYAVFFFYFLSETKIHVNRDL